MKTASFLLNTGSAIFFFTLPHKRHNFHKTLLEHNKKRLYFLYDFRLFHSKANPAKYYLGLHVKCPLLLSEFNQHSFFGRFSKSPRTKFDGNRSSGSRYVSCGQAGRRQVRRYEANGRLGAILRTSLKTFISGIENAN
jgi:hypothetical protein